MVEQYKYPEGDLGYKPFDLSESVATSTTDNLINDSQDEWKPIPLDTGPEFNKWKKIPVDNEAVPQKAPFEDLPEPTLSGEDYDPHHPNILSQKGDMKMREHYRTKLSLEDTSLMNELGGTVSQSKTLENFEGSNRFQRLRAGDLNSPLEKLDYYRGELGDKYNFSLGRTLEGQEVFFRDANKEEAIWYPVRNYRDFFGDVYGSVGSVSAETAGAAVATGALMLLTRGGAGPVSQINWGGRLAQQGLIRGSITGSALGAANIGTELGAQYVGAVGGNRLSQMIQAAQGLDRDTKEQAAQREKDVGTAALVGESFNVFMGRTWKLGKGMLHTVSPYNTLSDDAIGKVLAGERAGALEVHNIIMPQQISPIAKLLTRQNRPFSEEIVQKEIEGKIAVKDFLKDWIDTHAKSPNLPESELKELFDSNRDILKWTTYKESEKDFSRFKEMASTVYEEGNPKKIAKFENAMEVFQTERLDIEQMGDKIRKAYVKDYVEPKSAYFKEAYKALDSEVNKYNPTYDTTKYEEVLFNDKHIQSVLAPKDIVDEVTGETLTIYTPRDPALTKTNSALWGTIQTLQKEVKGLYDFNNPERAKLLKDHIDQLEKLAYPNELYLAGDSVSPDVALARRLHRSLRDMRGNPEGIPDSLRTKYQALTAENADFHNVRDTLHASKLVSKQPSDKIGESFYNSLSPSELSFYSETLPPEKLDEILRAYKANVYQNTGDILNHLSELEGKSKDMFNALFPDPTELAQLKAVGMIDRQWKSTTASNSLDKALTGFERFREIINTGSQKELALLIKGSKDPQAMKAGLAYGMFNDAFTKAKVFEGTNVFIDTRKFSSTIGKYDENGTLDLLFSKNVKDELKDVREFISLWDELADDGGAGFQTGAVAAGQSVHTGLTNPKQGISSRLEAISKVGEAKRFQINVSKKTLDKAKKDYLVKIKRSGKHHLIMDNRTFSLMNNLVPPKTLGTTLKGFLRLTSNVAPQAYREWMEKDEERNKFYQELENLQQKLNQPK